MKESILYYIIKIFAFFIRLMPLSASLFIGKVIGIFTYYFDIKHKTQVYANLKMAFAQSKSSNELKKITKELFMNYGQNIIELLRLPLMNPDKFRELVTIEGEENVCQALKKGKGLILLAMHFGSWEMASLSCGMLGHSYKVIVKSQDKYSKLDNLLNEYRSCGGSIVLSRGIGMRDFIKSLKNNEIIGMVADQGGRDGILIPFFERDASMSVGAMRMALKNEVPVCFAIVIRQKGGKHKMIIHKPFEIERTENYDSDVENNLKNVVKVMEQYISQYPSEYMWFYKIWKYSKQANIAVLSDGKMGHLRQSQLIAEMIRKALSERQTDVFVQTINLIFKNKITSRLFNFFSFLSNPLISQGRLDFLKWFLTKESFKQISTVKADFIISCGSSIAGLNYLLSLDHNAKSIAVQRPGIMSYKKFDLVFLPQHDVKSEMKNDNIIVTKGAPNLITKEYINNQCELLLNRFSHLKSNLKYKIGVFIGGNSENIFLSEPQIKILIQQLLEAANALNSDIILTTSRRTPDRIEQLLYKFLKKNPRCPLLIIANQENVNEAVGGILGLSDIVVVSGDSISMISEAASSGKKTIVFMPKTKEIIFGGSHKHERFIEKLNSQGYILSADVNNISRTIFDVAKNKIQTRILNDRDIIFESVKKII